MNKIILSLILVCITLTLTAQEDVIYRVRIKSSPIILEKDGKEVPGKARVRIELEGTEGSVLTGKQVESSFGTITFSDEPIGKIIAINLSIEGVYWTRRIDIEKVVVSVTNEDDEIKRTTLPGGCTLTKGNSKVYIDKGGPVDFMADEESIALEDERINQIEIEGEFSSADTKGDGFTISSTEAKNYEKELETINEESDKRRICTVKKYEASASFDLNFLTNTSTTAIYPGALISSESIAKGTYINIPAKREPITLSTNIAVIGSPIIQVDNPKLSSIRGAMNDLLVSQERGDIQIQANFEIKEVHSKEQLSIALGGHFAYGGGEVNFDFSYDSEDEKTVKVVKFAQIYYTMDMDQPDSAFDVFQEEKDALRLLNSGETPLVVSQVTYGRIAYFFMKTTASSMEIKAHLDAAYEGASVSASGSADLGLSKLLEESETSALIIGGDSGMGITAVDGYEGFIDMLRDGGTLSPSSLGVPVSYVLRYLSDWKVARVNLATTYNKRECREIKKDHVNIQFNFEKIQVTGWHESSPQYGYKFEVALANNNNKYKRGILYKEECYDDSGSSDCYVSFFKTDKETKAIGFKKPLKIKLSDIDKYQIKLWGKALEYDDFDDDEFHGERFFPLRDCISTSDTGTSSSSMILSLEHGADVIEFHVSTKVLDD